MSDLSHREDCTGVELEDDCAPARGDWNQPAGHLANEARDRLMTELGQEPPWCRIHERAWEIAPQEDQPQEDDRGPQ